MRSESNFTYQHHCISYNKTTKTFNCLICLETRGQHVYSYEEALDHYESNHSHLEDSIKDLSKNEENEL